MQECRLIVEGSAPASEFQCDGALNMAIDEVLLRSASESNQTTLRFYGWKPATLSLGYFQRHTDRQTHPASLPCNLVRRSSGGGAILHDHELTYCFASPVGSRFGQTEELYLAFHETLVDVLDSHFGVETQLHETRDGLTDEAFLCFQRRASGDVICQGSKVAGSAQRRWKNAIVQHGSVLLSESAYSPELPGLLEMASYDVQIADLIKDWLDKLISRLKIDVLPSRLTDRELEGASSLRSQKFANKSWTERR